MAYYFPSLLHTFSDDASIVVIYYLSHLVSFLLISFIEKLKILQVHIVQRGAVRPLIEMLQSSDVQLREMSAFALGRLAQVIIYLCMFFTFFKSQFMDTIWLIV